ncbi:apolipoprotein N-acyltransferase [Lysobacter pythonis]|uniref:Apolipoprotein N-acyltransferase n=1 Tax=Solilutibacter pythonis TaxID=2483112 RepID=A0A3M2HXZ5_9GAMM|nr:apolipoprotein N-acyltransferase [Lysobacter pythonis]RMH91047.1 apolipoprotein N-acyltransferase [Lysobacter pythonis]
MTRFLSGARTPVELLACGLLFGLYARGGNAFILGFVALAPWLVTLDKPRGLVATVSNAWAMSVVFVLAAFHWFAFAIADYFGIEPALALASLTVAAPLLQPQWIAFALVRRWAARRHGPPLVALAGASAWAGCEWLWPKLLGDTLGHGLYPSPWLRQFADVAGAAGLSFALILANEALALAFARRCAARREWGRPLAVACAVPLLLAGYGMLRLPLLASVVPEAPLRIGMVQSNIVDYDRLRADIGAYEVVRRVLDTHFALSYPLARAGRVDALLWSETVYPTTYGQPKSEDGATFDREIADFVAMTRVPLVFGTYDADPDGEYNAAAFVGPRARLLGFYRKTRLFFGTEYLPRWAEELGLRRLLPWAGAWRPGQGARVMPLRLADGREVPVQALICLDDVDPGLAIDGARLGAHALLGMSNDSWFTRHPVGARLHLQVAAFRSIETRLPQARVTSNGFSAAIDATGALLAETAMDEQAVRVAELAARPAPFTPMRMLGDWLGKAGLVFLVLLAVRAALSDWRGHHPARASARAPVVLPRGVAMMSPAMRVVIVGLQLFARAAVLWMGVAWLLGEAGQDRLLTQLRTFVALVLLPEASAWLLMGLHRARLAVDDDGLRLFRRGREVRLLRKGDGTALRPWALPLPADGVSLRAPAGRDIVLSGVDPAALARALDSPSPATSRARLSLLAAQARAWARRGRLDHPLPKFLLFPLLPALPAFRLHQIIAFGGTFGEAYVHGWKAWFAALGLWWASWIVMMVLWAGALRAAVEAVCLAAPRIAPTRIVGLRTVLESAARWLYYLGVPVWLAWRMLAA